MMREKRSGPDIGGSFPPQFPEIRNAGVDLVGAVTLSHDGNFDEPSFSAALERDFLIADFVRCDLHNG